MTSATPRPQVELLTRDGCTICERIHARLVELAAELGFELSTTDVDAAAAAGNPGLRTEFGDRLPVICSTVANTATGTSTSHGCAPISPAELGPAAKRLFGSPADKRLPWTAVQLLEEARELAR